jgi:hypothetical protein
MCFINNRIHKLMIGTSCVFILTKLSDLSLYYFFFFFFFHMYDYTVLDSGYRKASGYVRGFDSGDA